jgi:glycosyltransferase involved in cell wall biosynthesis
MVRYSGNRTGVIGFDCVPLSTAETVQSPEVSNGFAANLAAIAHVDTVATISRAAATEYGGWRTMLAGTGLPGPRIQPVLLPAEASATTEVDMQRARASLTIGGLPMVLVVGSHEPRKNHRTVLHAAELLWRRGVEFSLLFVGGNAWGSETFHARVTALAAQGHPVHLRSAIGDDELWAAYRVARCTVFPSLNEGFGLPLAESLAAGTPSITSAYGSMAEIAADGGALLVDPRDAGHLASALERLVTDDLLHASLRAEALRRPPRTWDDYAAELWTTLVAS